MVMIDIRKHGIIIERVSTIEEAKTLFTEDDGVTFHPNPEATLPDNLNSVQKNFNSSDVFYLDQGDGTAYEDLIFQDEVAAYVYKTALIQNVNYRAFGAGDSVNTHKLISDKIKYLTSLTVHKKDNNDD